MNWSERDWACSKFHDEMICVRPVCNGQPGYINVLEIALAQEKRNEATKEFNLYVRTYTYYIYIVHLGYKGPLC